jgi:hypothetical protein
VPPSTSVLYDILAELYILSVTKKKSGSFAKLHRCVDSANRLDLEYGTSHEKINDGFVRLNSFHFFYIELLYLFYITFMLIHDIHYFLYTYISGILRYIIFMC